MSARRRARLPVAVAYPRASRRTRRRATVRGEVTEVAASAFGTGREGSLPAVTVLDRTGARFDGWIAGLGTAAGLRAVVGHWPVSPFGAFTDVMVERPDGHRMLLAPSEEVAAFVAGTYRFDEVCRIPVTTTAGTAGRCTPGRWISRSTSDPALRSAACCGRCPDRSPPTPAGSAPSTSSRGGCCPCARGAAPGRGAASTTRR